MVSLTTEGQSARLTISERVRVPGFAELHAAALAAAACGTDVELDLGATDHLHAGAAQILAALARGVEAAGRRCRIIAMSSEARDALLFTGLSDLLKETQS